MLARKSARKGFTLIELLLVMVILVILSSVVVLQFKDQSKRARIASAKTDISMYESAIGAFEVDMGRYPSNDEGLSILSKNPGSSNWNGPYVKFVQPDPWGHAYIYQAPGSHLVDTFDLSSAGPDQHEGNDDDIVNWQT